MFVNEVKWRTTNSQVSIQMFSQRLPLEATLLRKLPVDGIKIIKRWTKYHEITSLFRRVTLYFDKIFTRKLIASKLVIYHKKFYEDDPSHSLHFFPAVLLRELKAQ